MVQTSWLAFTRFFVKYFPPIGSLDCLQTWMKSVGKHILPSLFYWYPFQRRCKARNTNCPKFPWCWNRIHARRAAGDFFRCYKPEFYLESISSLELHWNYVYFTWNYEKGRIVKFAAVDKITDEWRNEGKIPKFEAFRYYFLDWKIFDLALFLYILRFKNLCIVRYSFVSKRNRSTYFSIFYKLYFLYRAARLYAYMYD